MIKMVKKYNAESLFKLDGHGHVEILRLVPKSAGVVAYLPHDVLEFLNLHREDRSLVALLDDEGEYNYVILIADKDLTKLLRPLILARRQKAQRLQEELKAQLQAQKQQAEAAISVSQEYD